MSSLLEEVRRDLVVEVAALVLDLFLDSVRKPPTRRWRRILDDIRSTVELFNWCRDGDLGLPIYCTTCTWCTWPGTVALSRPEGSHSLMAWAIKADLLILKSSHKSCKLFIAINRPKS